MACLCRCRDKIISFQKSCLWERFRDHPQFYSVLVQMLIARVSSWIGVCESTKQEFYSKYAAHTSFTCKIQMSHPIDSGQETPIRSNLGHAF